jgi:hypothetical protein
VAGMPFSQQIFSPKQVSKMFATFATLDITNDI